MRLQVLNGWRRVWALRWQWKGLGLVVTSFFVVGVGLSVVLGSDDDTAGSDVTTSTPTSTAAVTPRSTPSTSPVSIATSEASQETPPQQSSQQSPSPAPTPKPDLTAAEVIECEFGQFDGWDDAFNLKSFGSTPFPASLKATTDPVACETLWLTSYDNGYSDGTNDICSMVLDYIDVASSGELAFCDLEPAPTPTPTPTSAPDDSELLYELGYNAGYPDGYADGSVGGPYQANYYIDPTIGIGSVYYPWGYNDGYVDGYSDGEDYFETIPQGPLP